MAFVSVIIPTHNRAELLRSAIASVLDQTYRNLEVIVVDDASTDHTEDVIRGFDDQRLKYLRQEVNKGPARVRNIGVINSTGRYIAFLDDDDQWLPQKLHAQVDLLENAPFNVGAVYTGTLRIDSATGQTVAEVIPEKRGDMSRDILVKNWVGTPSTPLLRKECFETVGLFDEEIIFCEDYDLWIRVAQRYRFEYIRKPLVKYYVHPDKLSTNHTAMITGIEMLLRKYSPLFANNRKSFSCRYLNIGVLYCYGGQLRKGREAFRQAIRIYPFEFRHYLNLFLSFLGCRNFKKLKALRGEVT